MTREEIIAAVQAGKCLARANLQGANLQKANLYEADLYVANLQEADLQEANLQRADLYGANLYEADLQEANLQGANLLFMYAYGAKTTGIKLSWIPKKGDLVRVYPEYPNADKSTLGVLLEDPDPDHVFNRISVRLHDKETKISITCMKPASRLEEIIQEELKRELFFQKRS
jgi:hypothetical protein